MTWSQKKENGRKDGKLFKKPKKVENTKILSSSPSSCALSYSPGIIAE